jgi:parvulin-like peptidyl-prolyl isomerase
VSFAPLLLAAALASSSGDEVVVRVDDVTITRATVLRRIEGLARNGSSMPPFAALDTLVSDALLSAEAVRLGLAGSPEVAAFVDGAVRRAAVRAMVESFAEKRPPDEAMLRKSFHGTSDFVAYEYLSYGSKADAEAARKRIDKGATLSAEAASAVGSQLYPNPVAAPVVMRAQLASGFGAALFAAEAGGVVGPIEDDKGWAVVRVLRKQVGSDAEYAARRPDLVASHQKQLIQAARTHLADQLKAKAGVKLDEAFLSSLRGAEASPEQLQHVVATVAGKPVRYAEVYPSVKGLGSQANHMASPAVKIQLARAIVDDRILEAFAVERGFDKSPEVVAQLPELQRNGLAGLVAARIHAAVKRPSDGEIERHYRSNLGRYDKPLKEVRRRVEAELLSLKRANAFDARLAELRGKAKITIDEAALARLSS